jgi:hypothetical protein
MCCTGLAPRQAQHTLLGNNCVVIESLPARDPLVLPSGVLATQLALRAAARCPCLMYVLSGARPL